MMFSPARARPALLVKAISALPSPQLRFRKRLDVLECFAKHGIVKRVEQFHPGADAFVYRLPVRAGHAALDLVVEQRVRAEPRDDRRLEFVAKRRDLRRWLQF